MALTQKQYQEKGMLLAVLPPAISAILLWIVYGVRVIFGFDLLDRTGRYPTSPTLCFEIALGGTALLIAWTILRARKVRALAKHGVAAEGKVVKVGLLGRVGRKPVTVAYRVNGAEYTTKQDMAVGPKKGDVVTVLYDVRKPDRCVVL